MIKVTIENGPVVTPVLGVSTKIKRNFNTNLYSLTIRLTPCLREEEEFDESNGIDLSYSNITKQQLAHVVKSFYEVGDILKNTYAESVAEPWADPMIDFDDILAYNEAAKKQENNDIKSLVTEIRAPFIKKYKEEHPEEFGQLK